MPRQDLQGMVAQKHQESLSPVLIKTQAMTQIQYHNCSQNGTHRIRQYLDGRIRQHRCATPNRTHRYDDESHNRNRPLICIHIHPLICPSHNDKETSKEKQRNRIIFTIFSACTGALTISFTNMGVIGIGFTDWLYVATFLLVIVAAAGIWLYSYTLFDTLKRKYGLMIKDLKELLLLKY